MSWTTSHRFDTNYIAKIGRIVLNNPNTGMPSWYSGWSIVRCQGEREENTTVTKNGVMTRPLNFSGTMATLLEFHKAMKTLETHARCSAYADAQEALADDGDNDGYQDISRNGQRMLPRNFIEFREFCVYSETTYYTTPDGYKNRCEVVTLRKRKSEFAMAMAKPGSSDFFMMRIPAHCLTNLVLALEMLMATHNIEPLECGVLNAPKFADKQRVMVYLNTDRQPPKKKRLQLQRLLNAEEEEVEEEENVEEEAVVEVKRNCKTPKESCREEEATEEEDGEEA